MVGYGNGMRFMDLTFYWGADAGFENLDLSGLHDYKKRWAADGGQRVEFTLCPNHISYNYRIL